MNNRDGLHTLSVDVESVTINCHFLCLEEIELDIDPEQIKGEKEHTVLLGYIAQLAKALGKTAYITPENSLDNPILTFNASTEEWVCLFCCFFQCKGDGSVLNARDNLYYHFVIKHTTIQIELGNDILCRLITFSIKQGRLS